MENFVKLCRAYFIELIDRNDSTIVCNFVVVKLLKSLTILIGLSELEIFFFRFRRSPVNFTDLSLRSIIFC